MWTNLNIGTFNLRSIKSNIRKEQLCQDLESYKIDVLCLQETKIQDGVDQTINGHRLLCFASSSPHYGCGFLINKNCRDLTSDEWNVSDRICVLELKCKINSRNQNNDNKDDHDPVKIDSERCSDTVKEIHDNVDVNHRMEGTTNQGFDANHVITRTTNQELGPAYVSTEIASHNFHDGHMLSGESSGINTGIKGSDTNLIIDPSISNNTGASVEKMNHTNLGFENDEIERSAGFPTMAIDPEDPVMTSKTHGVNKSYIINDGVHNHAAEVQGDSTLLSVDLDDRSEVEGSTLSVHDLNYTVKIRKWCWGQAVNKQILSKITGIFKPGLNAILGPTGCGKTSFLNALAGRVDKRSLDGDILMNGRPIPNNFKCMVGYVVQDDILVGTLTVRENFAFSAALRLPKRIKSAERKRLIDNVIKELGLQECADTKIGTPFIRGVSGGERKRCNIGMELIISPPVLFLDEPTSSLDANTANTVLSFLRRLADKGRTIIFSIHQPRYSIYKLFDRLMLLSGGLTAYHGPASQALEFFEKQGFVCQEHNNPPDFFLDVINADQSTLRDVYQSNRKSSQKQILGYLDQQAVHEKIVKGFVESNWNAKLQVEASKLYATFENHEKKDGLKLLTVGYATSFANQMKVVAGRAFRDMIRNPQTGLTVIGTSVFFALMLVAVFWQLKEDPITGFHDRTGVLFFMVLIQLFFNLSAMDTYVKERVIFLHENCSGFYRTSVYFLVKVFCHILPQAFLPVLLMSAIVYYAAGLRDTTEGFFLFALCVFLVSLAASGTCFFMAVSFQTFAAAQLVMSLAYTLMVLFSGYMVNLGSVKDWISWLQYLSVVKYGLAGLYINEFKDRTFCTANNTICKGGNEFMAENNLDFETSWDFWHNYLALFLLSFGLFVMTYVQLRRMKRHA